MLNTKLGIFFLGFHDRQFDIVILNLSFMISSLILLPNIFINSALFISILSNPNFFFLTYDKNTVNNFLVIPKQFFTPEIINKRKPLSINAKRAGWIGCNIDISKVPESGRIFIVENSKIIEQEKVHIKLKTTDFLKSKSLESRGWILDILNCIEEIKKQSFTLDELYAFEEKLKIKYPNNNHIKDKIRQQLQFLRDKGLIEFNGRGNYKKIEI